MENKKSFSHARQSRNGRTIRAVLSALAGFAAIVPLCMFTAQADTNGEAINEAGQIKESGEYHLAKDIAADEYGNGITISNGINVTLDLNGHSIQSPYGIVNYGTVEIIGDGKISGCGTGFYNAGTAVVNGGVFENSGYEDIWNVGGSLTISGGEFSGNITDEGKTTINGGLFKTFLQVDNEPWKTTIAGWKDNKAVPENIRFSRDVYSNLFGRTQNYFREFGATKEADGSYSISYVGSAEIAVKRIAGTEANVQNEVTLLDGDSTVAATSGNTPKTVPKKMKYKVSIDRVGDVEGYTFKGWYTNSDGIGEPIGTNKTLNYTIDSLEDNITLYVVFEKDKVAPFTPYEVQAWLDAQGDKISIDDIDDMTKFALALNYGISNFERKTVTLINDLDYTNKDYTIAATTKAHEFRGTFDGNGHTISNVSLAAVNKNQAQGLFGYITIGTVKNLIVNNMTLNGGISGAIVGIQNGGNILDCTVNKVTINNAGYGGGIMGQGGDTPIVERIKVADVTITDVNYGGGVAGGARELNIRDAEISGYSNTSATDSGILVGKCETGTQMNLETIKTTDTPSYSLIGTLDGKVILSGETNIIVTAVTDTLKPMAEFYINSGSYSIEHVFNHIPKGAVVYIAPEVSMDTAKKVECYDISKYEILDDDTYKLTKSEVRISIIDTDAYVGENGNGNIRYLTEITVPGMPAIEKIGTWFIPSNLFNGSAEDIKNAENVMEISSDSIQGFSGTGRYNADVMEIPDTDFDTELVGVSFIIVNGDTTISDIVRTTVNQSRHDGKGVTKID